MRYDIKAQKKPELQDGVALSTVVFDDEEEVEEAREENQPPSPSTANDAD